MTLFPAKKNKLAPSALLLLVLIHFAVVPAQAQRNGKNTKKELESKKKRIHEEIGQINTMLNETKASKKSSIGALVSINIKLEKRQDLIKIIDTQINALNNEIKENEDRVQRMKSSLEKLKREYARMIVYAQRSQDSYTFLMFIFAAESFNQAYSRLKYMQQYSEFRRKQAMEIINTQTELLAKINELRVQYHEKKMLLVNEQKEKKILSVEKVEKEQLVNDLQKKERELKNELEKRKQAAIQLQAAIKQLIEAEIKRKTEEANRAELKRLLSAKKAKEEKARVGKNKAGKSEALVSAKSAKQQENSFVPVLNEEAEALSNDFANNRGRLPWPVTKGVICETYGEHEHPAIQGFMMFNNGVEICAATGARACAVFDGEVTGIAVSPAGGKLVIIRHGEYLSVYSNLSEVTVKTGQKVNVKQPIGTILFNEDESKTSLNLQIWKGQKTMDPGGWLFNAR